MTDEPAANIVGGVFTASNHLKLSATFPNTGPESETAGRDERRNVHR